MDYAAIIENFLGAEEIDGITSIENTEHYSTKLDCDCCHVIKVKYTEANGYRVGYGQIEGTYSICDDCLYVFEYGRLPDDIMPKD